MTTLLKVDNLTLQRGETKLLEGLSFELQAGQLMQVRGANGCGKSTLMRLLASVYTTENQDDSIDFTKEAGMPIYVSTDSGFYPELSIIQNIKWILSLYLIKVNDRQIETALAAFEMNTLRNRPFSDLSSGQKMRAVLSVLSLLPSQLWLLDEPFVALDQAGQNKLIEHIQLFLQQGGAVMLVTHQDIGLECDLMMEFGT